MSTATITRLPSGSWHTRVYSHTDASGKKIYKSITAPTKTEVKRLMAEFLAARSASTVPTSEVTVHDAIKQHIDTASNILSPSTRRAYMSILNNRIPSLMPVRVRDLTPTMIQQAFNAEAAEHSAKTVRNVHALFTAACKLAVPTFTDASILPKKQKPDIRIPTDAEMQKIFEALRGKRLEVAVYLAAVCGMRRSEILALRWDHVDLENGYITIDSARVKDEHGDVVTKQTKTSAGKRRIKAFTPVLALLRTIPHTSDYVTWYPQPNRVTDSFASLLRQLDIPHFRFHDLRHYAVSTMLSLNVPKNYIADYVGHEDEHMIDTVYGHIMETAKLTFLDTVDAHYASLFRP